MQFKQILKWPSAVGLFFGTLLLAASLTPSLIPRGWMHQGVIAGLSFACGYVIGVGLNALWRYLELYEIPQRHRRRVTWGAVGASVIVLICFLSKTLAWQNNVRQMVEQAPVDGAFLWRIVLLALAIATILILLSCLLLWAASAIVRVVHRFVPYRFGQVIGLLIVFWFFGLLMNGVLIRSLGNVMNSYYATTDSGTDANVHQPTSTLRAGSPASGAQWETLGKQGRRFSGTGPSGADIAAYW